MQVECAVCGRSLEFSGVRPSFCGYCGKPLRPSTQEGTLPYEREPGATRAAEADTAKDFTALPPEVRGFRLLGLLGSGGMGSVYQAEDLASGRRVALKLISPQYAASASAVERFRQEGRLASLIAHPCCVFVLAADEDAGRPYIVMELMPGATLQELVERQGPLPQAEAVAKILDVVEGLQEAHRLGVIHRDVKPSNCFVLEDGRVKVGDFGLAKSLLNVGGLTRTGTFLGTLLYAPPEQIKGEAIDVRTDVYSVCATLYFLLTGQAPYHGKDAAATLARTVSEPPPPPRALRPGLSPKLEQVVLRGLGRQRGERWRDLEELRQALLRFAPGQLRPASFTVRLGALILDWLLFFLLGMVVNLFTALEGQVARQQLVTLLAMRALQLLPWWFLEGWFGWSPGKWLLHLRVCTPQGGDPPGLGRSALRILVFYGFLSLPSDLGTFALLMHPEALGLALLAPLGPVLGAVVLMATMRARSGYRGLHEWLSDTRVVRLPTWEWQRPLHPRHANPEVETLPREPLLPEHLGPYSVRGRLGEQGGAVFLLGEDPALGRSVWLRVVRPDGVRLTEARRRVNRPTRLPWLTGGAAEGLSWDAFLAATGCPLADLVDRRCPLTWGETRPLLLQLCEELLAAERDGTLPPQLSLARVWVQPNGRLQLLDVPLPGPSPEVEADAPLDLVRLVALVALEGQYVDKPARRHVRAPVPPRAAGLLDRLIGGPRNYQSVAEVHAALADLQGQPTRINRALRSAHLTLLVVLLTPLLAGMFGVRYLYLVTNLLILQQQAGVVDRALEQLEDEPDRAAFLADLDRLHPEAEYGFVDWRQYFQQRQQEFRAERARWTEAANEDFLARNFVAALPPEKMIASGKPRDAELRALFGGSEAGRSQGREMMIFVLVGVQWFYVGGCVLWALVFRGGFTMRLVGISLRRRSGRSAARWQCAWRTLLFWVPISGLLNLALLALLPGPEGVGLSLLLWLMAAAVLAGYLPLALWRPARSLHDRLAGTYLMPS